MSRLILQTNVKLQSTRKFSVGRTFKVINDLYYISELQARRFATKWNADYIQITNCDYLPDKHPTFQRFKMYDMNYDQILYLDMDAVILPSCPDIFSLFNGSYLSAVRNNRWDNSDLKVQQRRKDDIKLLGASDDYRPFCAGVMLIGREFINKTKDSWRKYLYQFDKHEHDQTMMNKLIVEHFYGKYNELDEKWGAWYRKGIYIDHLGGPFRKINFDKKKYMLSNGIYDVIPASFKDIMP